MATFNDAKGRQVVATDTAENIGSVRGFVVDPGSRAVTAIHIAGSGDDASMLAWDDVAAFGVDAVMATRADAVRAPAGESEVGVAKGESTLPGTRVLSADGHFLGTATDAGFDPATGSVTSVITDRGEFSGGALHAIGSYAIVVDSDVELVPEPEPQLDPPPDGIDEVVADG
ncbi:hypothetical protein BH24ACT5_BH24ACT5_10460 [soil metagenome]